MILADDWRLRRLALPPASRTDPGEPASDESASSFAHFGHQEGRHRYSVVNVPDESVWFPLSSIASTSH
jgi:hypothetical protein